jgi:prepilin-type processing-associated H-X9-DG protein
MNNFRPVDLISIIVIILLLMGFLIPSVLASREVSRRSACMNKLRQIGTAMQQYHEKHESLPGHKVGPGSGNRISAFTLLLPHLGYQGLYDDIVEQKWQSPSKKEKVDAQGRSVKGADGKDLPSPYCKEIPVFLCPADSARSSKNVMDIGFNNYVVSHGDWITNQNERFTRGPFVPGNKLTFKDITDGLSNTLAMSERSIASSKRKQPDGAGKTKSTVKESDVIDRTQGNIIIAREDADTEDREKPSIVLCFQKSSGDILINPETLRLNRNRAGTRWSDGLHVYTTMNTILPPNGASCMLNDDDQRPLIAPPSSYHITGVNVLMLDGRVRFVSNNIDCGGDYASKRCVKEGASPFGVWGAMGCINGKASGGIR